MDEKKVAAEVLAKVGGKDNVTSVVHCATRLRFKLKNETIVDTEKVEAIEGVLKVVQSGGQYQVVIGNEVKDVFRELEKLVGPLDEPEKETDSADAHKKKGNLFNALIDTISGVFTPILGVLAAAGMVKGLAAGMVTLKILTEASGTYQVLYAIGDGMFYFFPIILGYSAAKKFGGNAILGMAIGASMLYPKLQSLTESKVLYTLFEGTVIASPIHTTFLGLPLIVTNYSSTVIPIIVAAYFGARIEHFFKRVIPKILRSFFTPFLTLLVIVPLALLVIGPIATWLAALLGLGTLTILKISPIVTGFILAGLWQFVVMFGLHWGVLAIAITNMSTIGYDPIFGIVSVTTFAQIGACLAVALKTRNPAFKELGLSAFVSGLFGVTEPALYGITLPLKKPFYFSCFASAIGGLIAAVFGSKLYFLSGLGIFGLPSFIKPGSRAGSSFFGFCIAIVVSFIAAFILTYLFAQAEPKTQINTAGGK